MLKYQRNFNAAGGISCLCLLLLTFSLINPFANLPASAIEEASQADSEQSFVSSSIEIEFLPVTSPSPITPTTPEGVSAQATVRSNIGIKNSGGYSIYLGGSGELVGQKTGATISGTPSPSTLKNLPSNTWGYSVITEENLPSDTTYKALSAGQGDLLASQNTSVREANHTFTLGFATKIGVDRPADTYEGKFVLSVISSPRELVTLSDLDTLQQMTSKICENTTPGTEVELVDERDGQTYPITKFAKDNNCWITRNLDYALDPNTPLTSKLSDVSATWTPPATVLTGSPSNFNNSSNDLVASYRSTDNVAYGTYYSWGAATAGTGNASFVSGSTDASVCPRGWTLPTHAQYSAIFTGMSSGNELIATPYNFKYGGRISNGSLDYLGGGGYYWSSTVNDVTTAFIVPFDPGVIWPSGVTSRFNGCSVRCVAR